MRLKPSKNTIVGSSIMLGAVWSRAIIIAVTGSGWWSVPLDISFIMIVAYGLWVIINEI